MNVSEAEFYNEQLFGIVPMGFCYPGKGKSGDLPPRKECAPLWHKQLLTQMPALKLTLLIGNYAQKYYLGDLMKKNLTETVLHAEIYAPDFLPLPHPSPRNRFWMKKNPWFEQQIVPLLRSRLSEALGTV